MPPRTRQKDKPASSTNKALDEFLAQSTVPAGQQQLLENKQKAEERLKELEEKYFQMNHTTQI